MNNRNYFSDLFAVLLSLRLVQAAVVGRHGENRRRRLHVEGRGHGAFPLPLPRTLLLLDLLLLDVAQVRVEGLRGLHLLRARHHRAAGPVQNNFGFVVQAVLIKIGRKRFFIFCDWLVFEFAAVASACNR